MSVLVSRSLEKADCRQVSCPHRCPEVLKIVLVARLVRLTDHRHGQWRQMMRVRRRLIILERFMVWKIIGYRRPVAAPVLSSAHRYSIRLARRRPKTALEPSPGDALLVEQVTY